MEMECATCLLLSQVTFQPLHLGRCWSLSIVGRRRDISTVAGPVGVDEMPRVRQQFIRVGSKVIPLGLEKQNRKYL